MSILKVGCKVRAIGEVDGINLKDKTGTILTLDNESIGVEFDDTFPEGHSCGGDGKNGHCRWVNKVEIELIKKVKSKESVKYILQYELNKDQFETFTSKKDLNAKIKVLLEKEDLKRESLVVYDVSKTTKVEVDWLVKF